MSGSKLSREYQGVSPGVGSNTARQQVLLCTGIHFTAANAFSKTKRMARKHSANQEAANLERGI
jgi:hypothetical protein